MQDKGLANQALQKLQNQYFGANTASVVETINGVHQKGRIKAFGGVYWPAVNWTNERILKGERVRLLGRQGNTWIVALIKLPGVTPRYNSEYAEVQAPSSTEVQSEQVQQSL